MNNYNFNSTKEEIIEFIKNLDSYERCYIVRNIYSRFTLYIINPVDFEEFTGAVNHMFPDFIDKIQEISEIDDSFIYNELLETSNPVDKSNRVFFSERHIENTNWFINDSIKTIKAPITSFYSFKGGVGRTTATILTSLLLARQGKKVLLIDFDLEAPGLASVFASQEENSEELLSVKGFVDFLIDYDANKRDLQKISIDDYYFTKTEQILVGTKGGELVIVPAIATNSKSAESYINKLSKANIKYGYGKEYIPDLFLKLLDDKISPDYIFIDTRTGINDVGGLVFNRYAQNIFLIFYGNQQNMFGLESILPELIDLNKKNVQFYLVNSPVPKNDTDAKIEIDYYINKSYEIFLNNFYIENIPSQFDETADHYPINIPFNDQALILNNYKKLSDLIENSNNAYQQIANIISSKTPITGTEDYEAEVSKNEGALECIINIDKGAGTSEVEFKTEEDLTKYFYPRRDYKYIFEQDKFLILGEKGVGKTALFSVLSHPIYAQALAKFCGIKNEEIETTKWVIGIEKDSTNFPNKANFQSLNIFYFSQFVNYWIILLLRNIDSSLIQDSAIKDKILKSNIKNIKEIAILDNIGEELYEILYNVNKNLKQKNETIIIVYDHLDAILPSEDDIRGKLVSALLTFYYDNINKLSNIKAKIFLRNDIFDREVNQITDKVKIQNYSVKIQWEYNQLLNVIWKRIYEQNENLDLFNGQKFDKLETLGSIPNISSEKGHKDILDKIFGKNMGGNNKAYPYNWVRLHIEDTNNKIHPRTLIKLFSESAKLQQAEESQPKDRIIRSKNIEIALRESVSKHQVEELEEEYPEFKKLFTELSGKVGGSSPMNEADLNRALAELNYQPVDTIKKLNEIGLLKDYKPYSKTKTDNEERRYHIPDLYLFGLKFNRRGTR